MDILIALAILAFGITLLVMKDDGSLPDKKVVIYKADTLILEVPLETDRVIDLSSFNVSMIIEIRDRKIRVASSSCPQQICVRKGWTGHVHDPVICAPNHILIEISGEDAGYDAVSH